MSTPFIIHKPDEQDEQLQPQQKQFLFNDFVDIAMPEDQISNFIYNEYQNYDIPKEEEEQEDKQEDKPQPSKRVKLSLSQFKQRYMADAERVAKQLQIDPNIILTQSYLESGGGKAQSLFGIKGGKSYKGKQQSFNTKEFLNGKMVGIQDSFRMYDSDSEAFDDYGRFISNSSRYKGAIGSPDAQTYFQRIKDGGYATDPNYVSKLVSLYNRMVNA